MLWQSGLASAASSVYTGDIMLTLDETQRALETLVERLPEAIFYELNGGVLLKEDVRLSPHRVQDDLFVLGEYYRDPVFGRYVVIYYGSMRRVFGHLPRDRFIEELDRVLKHELTHHLEDRAGDRDLEIEDARQLLHYYARHAPSEAES
jgi:hypothetical protein